MRLLVALALPALTACATEPDVPSPEGTENPLAETPVETPVETLPDPFAAPQETDSAGARPDATGG